MAADDFPKMEAESPEEVNGASAAPAPSSSTAVPLQLSSSSAAPFTEPESQVALGSQQDDELAQNLLAEGRPLMSSQNEGIEAEQVPAEEQPNAEADAAPAAAASAPASEPRAVGPRVYSTPEVLARLEPCSIFRVRLNFNDHRFTCETKASDERWLDKHAQKSYSKGFKIDRNWQGALRDVHSYMWEKFSVTRDKWPLRPGMVEQRPGEVPQGVFDDLQRTVESMPEPKY